MLCQVCGALNTEEREHCHRCGNKPMVVSGVSEEEQESSEEFIIQAQEELEEGLGGGPADPLISV